MIPNGRPARRWLTARTLSSGAAIMALTLAAHPALAQGTPEARLDKVESEVRALQRKVFPGPDGKYFEPQVTTGQAAAPATGTPPPATTAVTDLLTRMDSIEAQMRQLTSQVEQNTNRINLIEARMGSQLQAGVAATSASTVTPAPTSAVGPGFTPAATPAPAPVVTPTPKPTAPVPAVKPVAPSSARVEAVKAIVKPQTADAGDDEYSYGFRLWEAKFYPEAEQQLKAYLQKYPKHARVSFARNLLGRAYLDEGNASEAAKWFWQNYLADKRGDRAPDSLLYLAVSMKQLKDTNRACIALAEFSETYASEAAGRLKGLYDSTRSGLSCS